jgi:dUTP pyrophosphatase
MAAPKELRSKASVAVASDSPRSPAEQGRQPSPPPSQAMFDDDDDEEVVRVAKKIRVTGRVIDDDDDDDDDENADAVKIQGTLMEYTTPGRATAGSVGYDVFAVKEVVLEPQKATAIPLGFRLIPPRNAYGQLVDKSSMALKGLIVVGGVIDPDYRGEVAAIIFNLTSEPVTMAKGDAICQMVFLSVKTPSLRHLDVAMDKTERGERGCLGEKKNPAEDPDKKKDVEKMNVERE